MDGESFKIIHHVSNRYIKDPWYEAVSFLPRLTIFNVRVCYHPFAKPKLNAEDEQEPVDHGERRKTLAKHLSQNQIRQNFEHMVRDLCVVCINKIRKKSQEKPEVDLLVCSSCCRSVDELTEMS